MKVGKNSGNGHTGGLDQHCTRREWNDGAPCGFVGTGLLLGTGFVAP